MKKTVIGVGVAIIVVAIGSFAIHKLNAPANAGEYDAFAQCLTDKGVAMYGAWWCPHCQNQKKLFGSSFEKIRSIECAQPGNANAQTQECIDAHINGYPTWVFADGQRIEGEASFAALRDRTACALPENL
ncbi:hypothetical protein HY625_00445 [Candidatus Uhrbacteria bacterium]|nr:hypothetical protein [Candidatus Uhrbacteria bacterium]